MHAGIYLPALGMKMLGNRIRLAKLIYAYFDPLGQGYHQGALGSTRHAYSFFDYTLW